MGQAVMSQALSGGICLLEDDPIMGDALSQFFRLEKLPCDWFRRVETARSALLGRRYCAFVSDIRLPDGDGGELYRELSARPGHLPPTLFITAYGSVPRAVELLKLGARDYLTKPFEPDELMIKLRRACPGLFERDLTAGQPVLGVSPAMRRVEQMLERVARHRIPVLITGESGVGKEHAARYLHACREKARTGAATFVGINCAAMPEDLIESELFGAERGAYSGASASRPGLFEQAGEGTLFLDEVGEMSLGMQAKLLRVVQEQQVRRLGGTRDIPVRAQLIWATNRDLEQRIRAGLFREDLYFRLSSVRIELPPLRERPADIAWFAQRFLETFARENARRCHLTPTAESYLTSQPWQGNLRALKQAIERAAIFSDSGILEPVNFRTFDQFAGLPENPESRHGLRDALAECERWYIRHALERCDGRIGDSAELLGISRKNLWERMNRLEMARDPAQAVAQSI